MQLLSPLQASDLAAFDAVIDVRSPAEYAEDHIPGAWNLPVLDDGQREAVGTLYSEDAFAGRRLGAGLISANIAAHFAGPLAKRDREWHPLLYCWRGGMRSKSLALVLESVGWRVTLLQGGYKTFRRLVLDRTATLCPRLPFRVLTGLTGSGKSRLLRHMAAQGHQVLDLEKLANHRGSLLGDEPGAPQPSQKAFETQIWHQLEQFSPQRPVWVESESRRVGRLFCPDPLWESMVAAPLTELCTPTDLRTQILLEDYQHFLAKPEFLLNKLKFLKLNHGEEQIIIWEQMIRDGHWWDLTASLLHVHYDPAYCRAGKYGVPESKLVLADYSPSGLQRAADQLG